MEVIKSTNWLIYFYCEDLCVALVQAMMKCLRDCQNITQDVIKKKKKGQFK